MPNYCMVDLTIRGEREKVIEFGEALIGKHDVFETSLGADKREEFISLSYEDKIKYLKELKEKGETSLTYSNIVPMPEELLLVSKSGVCSGWYSWRINKWGVKWDIDYQGDIEEYIDTLEYIHKGELDELCIYYEAPWCYPHKFLLEASARYPDIVINLKAEENVSEIYKDIDYKNGECQEMFSCDTEMEWMAYTDRSMQSILDNFIGYNKTEHELMDILENNKGLIDSLLNAVNIIGGLDKNIYSINEYFNIEDFGDSAVILMELLMNKWDRFKK